MTKLLSMLLFLSFVAVLFYGAHRFAPESAPAFATTEQVLSTNFLDLVDGLNAAELDFGFVNSFVAGKRNYVAIIGSAPPKRLVGRQNPFSTIPTPFEDSFRTQSRTGVSPGPGAVVEDTFFDSEDASSTSGTELSEEVVESEPDLSEESETPSPEPVVPPQPLVR